MNIVKAFFSKIANLFTSPRGKAALDEAANLTAEALPYISIAGSIITGLTPTTLDDQALAMLKGRYPQLFDGSIQDGEHLKLFAFAAAADLLQKKYPVISTSVARLAVQTAFTADRA